MSQYEGRKGPIGENIRDILPGSRMPAADSTLVFFVLKRYANGAQALP